MSPSNLQSSNYSPITLTGAGCLQQGSELQARNNEIYIEPIENMENILLSNSSLLIKMPPSFCIMDVDPCDLHWFGETCLKAEVAIPTPGAI